MPSHDDLKSWDKAHVWHAFTQMAEYEPLLIERARGCTLVDIDGREYLDGVSSPWCNVHGHRHPKIDAAIRKQLDEVAHVTLLGMAHPTTVQLARRLVELAPGALNHVFFSSDGSCAVEVALKMAFQYWRQRRVGCAHQNASERTDLPDNSRQDTQDRWAQPTLRTDLPDDAHRETQERWAQPNLRTKYLAWENAYHGDTLGSVSVGGVARFHEMFRPLLFDCHRLPAPDAYRLPPGVARESACQFYLDQLAAALAKHGKEIAAVVIEPLVQAAAGIIVHPPGFLRGVRKLTRQHDMLLIADEVAVGMGRTGKLFACEQEGVEPDFLCLGKGLTGGYLPLAATLATDEIYSAFLGRYEESRTFFHGHTYGGNPLGAAAALATLEVFDEEQTLDRLKPKVARLAEHLSRIAKLPHVGDVRQRGLMAGIELVRDRATKEPYPWAERRGLRVCQHALSQGVWLRPLGNVIVIMPPLAVSLEELDRICEAVECGIRAVTELGL
jgi:adenosylmethionine-8-amino-7-oxononanoate aminotransferase